MSSDSDDDLIQDNNVNHVLLQNEDTVFSTKGPPNLSRNISAFQSNILTSTMQNPNQSVPQRYGGPNFDQWSMYRRETSPMSLRSVPNTRSYNFSHFDNVSYRNGMGYQRSMSSRRRASPASLRSVGTTSSVSVADIVFALKNDKFNKYEVRIMKEAIFHLSKSNRMHRIRKRKKLVLKSSRRMYGDDSGEQGSDSSSSDDCRSVKTICNKNISGLGYKNNAINHRDYPIQNMHMYNIIENPLLHNCSDQIKQNSLRNMFSTSSGIINARDQVQITQNHTQMNDVINLTTNNKSVMTQKDRFKKGYLIPSQRFNKTAAGQTRFKDIEHNKIRAVTNQTEPELLPDESNSDSENIFNNISVSKRDTLQDIYNKQNRKLTPEDVLLLSEKNKTHLHSPKRSTNCGTTTNYKPKDFNFAIPYLPSKQGKPYQAMSTKKGKSNEDTVPETLLAQSHVYPIVEEDHIKYIPDSKSRHIDKENGEPVEINILSDPLPSTSDVSMRPSFIKRKLFSLKLDDAEIKNVSSDSMGERQQNIYSAPIRERNKAKKIVTSQSCLSRDVQDDTNDVLDLIHKIVPPDKMNLTNVNRKTNPCKSNSKNVENTHKWDVTSVIANCDSQDVSDTYTDEEIFTIKQYEKVEKKNETSSSTKKLPQCNVVVTKMNVMDNTTKKNICGIASKGTTNKKTIKEYVKNFWGTDLESDVELNVPNLETFYQKRDNFITAKESSKKEEAHISNTARLPTVRTRQNFDKESASSNIKIIDKQVIEISQPYRNRNLGQERTKNGRTHTKPYNNQEKDVTSHNIPVNSNKEESGRKRNNVNCKTHKPNDTCNETKVSRRLRKTSISNSKDSKVVNPTICNSKVNQNNKDATNKNINPNQHFNANKPSTYTASNVRVQPKRKSKENSFVEKHAAKRSKSNNVPITKALKESASKSTSSNSPSFPITRYRKKILSTSCDWNQSNLDLSNISNRSLRYLQRERNKNVNSN